MNIHIYVCIYIYMYIRVTPVAGQPACLEAGRQTDPRTSTKHRSMYTYI